MGLGLMSRTGKALLVLLTASYAAASGIALLLGAYSAGRLLIVPALVVSGWASIRYLVTLDDDAPGEWSNPAGSRKGVAPDFALPTNSGWKAAPRLMIACSVPGMPNKRLQATRSKQRAPEAVRGAP
jgi:hypothetical protein